MKQEQATAGQPRKRQTKVYSAKYKSQAVLSLWSGRRNAAVLMKELGVSWGMLDSWEQRALTGMLTALDPAWKQAADRSTVLAPRLEKLIAETVKPAAASVPAATT